MSDIKKPKFKSIEDANSRRERKDIKTITVQQTFMIHSRFIIKAKDIWKLVLIAVLVAPDDIFVFCPLYSSQTPASIAYQWLDYRFGVFCVVIFLLGICGFLKAKTQTRCALALLLSVMLFREVAFYIAGKSSLFTAHAYEIYLCLILGAMLALWTWECAKSFEECERLFWLICELNVATVYLNLLLGTSGMEGRYNAINLDVGTTGTLCGMVLIHMLLAKKVRFRFWRALLVVGAIFLSGSRVNLLLITALGLIILFSPDYSNLRISRKKLTYIVLAGMLLLIILVTTLLATSISANFQQWLNESVEGNRMLQSFNKSAMTTDGSVNGRMRSIWAGFDIIRKNPLGISGYFINLQAETVKRGFPTFPHSSMLNAYIFFGPLILLAVLAWGAALKKLWKADKKYFWELLYMLIFITISGGPIVNFKIYYIYIMMTALSFKGSLVQSRDSDRVHT